VQVWLYARLPRKSAGVEDRDRERKQYTSFVVADQDATWKVRTTMLPTLYVPAFFTDVSIALKIKNPNTVWKFSVRAKPNFCTIGFG